MDTITFPKPHDFHLHVRTGPTLRTVLPMTARQFAGAVIMPNLVPPVTSIEQALAYRKEIMEACGDNSDFRPLMTAYLTDDTYPEEIVRGYKDGAWVAVKLYPENATTNSAHGVTDIRNCANTLKAMEKADIPLLVHGELVHLDVRRVDPFDREALFIQHVLIPLRKEFPKLRIVFEHITTKEAVECVQHDKSGRLAATITPHHLWLCRTDLFEGGMRPHLYCLPPAKRERHRDALRHAVISDAPCFFPGTDSAPHLVSKKESDCCPGGIFSANAAIEYYLQIFEDLRAFDERFVAFMSKNGQRFYGLPNTAETVTFERREPWTVDDLIPVAGMSGEYIRPFLHADPLSQPLRWRMKE